MTRGHGTGTDNGGTSMLVALAHGRLLVARGQSYADVVVLVRDLDGVAEVLELAGLVRGGEELPDLTRQLDLLRHGAGRSVRVAGKLLMVARTRPAGPPATSRQRAGGTT